MNETIHILNRLLDASALRQQVLATNIATVNTPGFKRQEVRFRDLLADAIESGDRTRIEEFRPSVIEDTLCPARPDGNTVSMHTEMTAMTENSILYNFATRLVSSKYEGLKKAIRGSA